MAFVLFFRNDSQCHDVFGIRLVDNRNSKDGFALIFVNDGVERSLIFFHADPSQTPSGVSMNIARMYNNKTGNLAEVFFLVERQDLVDSIVLHDDAVNDVSNS